MSESRERIRLAMERAGLGRFSGELLGAACEGVRYRLEPETGGVGGVGGTRFGGGPDVPRRFEWPRQGGVGDEVNARFVAQIDLGELARLMPRNVLASAGMSVGLLSFFWWQEDPAGWDANGFRVYWFRGEPLERRVDPWSLHPDRVGFIGRLLGRKPSETGQGWRGCRAVATPGWWLNHLALERTDLLKRLSDRESDLLMVDEEEGDSAGGGGLRAAGFFSDGHHVLGCAQPVQGPVEVEAEQGETEGGAGGGGGGGGGEKAWLAAAERAADPATGWRCLLEVTSDGAPPFCFGDWGRLYFMIRAPDLAAGRLEGVRLVTQCH